MCFEGSSQHRQCKFQGIANTTRNAFARSRSAFNAAPTVSILPTDSAMYCNGVTTSWIVCSTKSDWWFLAETLGCFQKHTPQKTELFIWMLQYGSLVSISGSSIDLCLLLLLRLFSIFETNIDLQANKPVFRVGGKMGVIPRLPHPRFFRTTIAWIRCSLGFEGVSQLCRLGFTCYVFPPTYNTQPWSNRN